MAARESGDKQRAGNSALSLLVEQTVFESRIDSKDGRRDMAAKWQPLTARRKAVGLTQEQLDKLLASRRPRSLASWRLLLAQRRRLWMSEAHTSSSGAIDAVAAARSLFHKTADPFMQVCVAEKAAKAYATDGQDTACMVECEDAQAGLTSAGQLLAESLTYWYHAAFLNYERRWEELAPVAAGQASRRRPPAPVPD